MPHATRLLCFAALRKDSAAVERSLKQAAAKAAAEGQDPAEARSVSYDEYFRYAES